MNRPWLDLSDYSAKLIILRVRGTLAAVVVSPLGDKYEKALNGELFLRNRNNRDAFVRRVADNGSAYPSSTSFLQALKKVFPRATEVEFDEGVHYEDRSNPSEVAALRAASGSGARILGINRLGFEVVQDGDSRYFNDKSTGKVIEGEGAEPGLFLRAPDAASLLSSLEGFVRSIWKNKSFDEGKFKSFMTDVLKYDASRRDEVVASLSRASLVWMGKQSFKTSHDKFLTSAKLDSLLAPVVRDTNPTLSVIVQRLLGNDAVISDKNVFIDADNPVIYIPSFPKSTGINVFGADHSDNIGSFSNSLGRSRSEVGDAFPGKDISYLIFDGRGRDFVTAQKQFIQRISSRTADGSAVAVLPLPTNDMEKATLEALRSHLAVDYDVDGTLELLDPNSSSGVVVISVSSRLEIPNSQFATNDPVTVSSLDAAWTWSSSVLSDRAQKIADIQDSSSLSAEFKGGSRSDRNTYQSPYTSLSGVGQPRTMVPRNLEGATRDALAEIYNKYGDVDEFVASEYGYHRDDLGKYFSPEQIDCLALHAHAESRGRGFLVADDTGVGKGRFLAAVLRRQVIKGKKTAFFTARPVNLSDIWRDIVAINSGDLFKPLVLNNGAKIVDFKDNQVLFEGASKEQLDDIFTSGRYPDGYNLVIGSYGLMNRDVEAFYQKKSLNAAQVRSKWMTTFANEDVSLVVDEAHVAAGDSNTSKNVKAAVDAAGTVVYSSATFAAKPDNYPFYSRLFPEEISTEELLSMMHKGGEPFQEVLSSMLVRDGVMVRREFDTSKTTYETVVDVARFERNKKYMDSIAPILFELSKLNADLNVAIVDAAAGGKVYRRNRGFGSPRYTISRLFLAALKVDIVAEDAIEVLQNGGKPIILVENTMQQLFEELAEADEVEGVSVDIKALFSRVLRNSLSGVHLVDDATEVPVNIASATENPILVARVSRIKRLIDVLPDLSMSIIDDVKQRIEDAGFTVGEITGRTLALQNGRVVRRKIPDANLVKNDFNSGVLDAVILNSSGATGSDMHASPHFKDQRRRYLLELQPPADVVQKTQARGRPNRYDQVSTPVFKNYLSGLPIEARLFAMENAKLRRMSANTTSNRDTAQLTRGIPDLINPIGDMVCSRYAEARPDLMKLLDLSVSEVQGNTDALAERALINAEELRDEVKTRKKAKVPDQSAIISDNKRTANEILSRLMMLPVDMQAKVSDELFAEFNAAIEELEARGETPLKAHALTGIIHEKGRSVLEGGDNDSVFNGPMYMVDGVLELPANPMKFDQVAERIELGELSSSRSQSCIDRLKGGMEEFLSVYLSEGFGSVAEAIAKKDPRIVQKKKDVDDFIDILESIRPGKELYFTLDGDAVSGIVTRIDYPNRGYEAIPSLYGVEFVVPGDMSPRVMRLETIMRDPNFRIAEGLESDKYENICNKFDNSSYNKFSKVSLVVNNIFRAMRLNVQFGLGTLVSYTDSEGVVHRGVALNKKSRNFSSIPVEIPSSEVAMSGINSIGMAVFGNHALNERLFSFLPHGTDQVRVRMPAMNSRKFGFIYEDPTIVDTISLCVDLDNSSFDQKKPIDIVINNEKATSLLSALFDLKVKFWTQSVHRQWVQENENSADNDDSMRIK